MSIRGATLGFIANPIDQNRQKFFDAILAVIQPDLINRGRRLLPWDGSRDLPEVVQETIYQVLVKASRLATQQKIELSRSDEELDSYFRTIARNELTDQLTKLYERKGRTPFVIAASILDEVEAPQTPLSVADAKEAMAKLEGVERQIVLLRLKGESFATIAVMLELQEQAVRTRFYRIVKRLRGEQ